MKKERYPTIDLDKNGLITLYEVYKDVYASVNQESEQQPQISDEGKAKQIVVLKYKCCPWSVLNIFSKPAGANILLNGESKGQTDISLTNVAKGSYTIRLNKQGYKDKVAQIELSEGEEETVDLTLEPEDVGERDGMILIPKGCFQMGSNDGDDDEKPVHQVCVDAFYIGKTEVTVAEYAACVRAGRCSDYHLTGYEWPEDKDGRWGKQAFTESDYCNWGKSGRENHPMNCVDWDQAREYCEWKGGRLPTEAEWEYVARGTDGRIYPWGNSWDGTKANFCDRNCEFGWKDESVNDGYRGTAPVGRYLNGASPFGVLDMTGNVWEWTSDWYGTYSSGSMDNPHGSPTGSLRVFRGGGWGNEASGLRSAFRFRYAPAYRSDGVGFRLLVSVGQ